MKRQSIIGLFTAAVILLMCISCACQKDKIISSDTAKTATTTQSTNSTTEKNTSTTNKTTTNTTTNSGKQTTDEKLAAAAKLAESLVGKPYQYGAKGPDAFDNSGFLVYCYGQSGIMLPRRTGDIAKQGTAVEKANVKPGDAVFFYNEKSGVPEYAGIYIGDNQFVASNDEKIPVSVNRLDLPYFTEHFLFAHRF
jgi:cell wall-associated NlpC family hydrolase